MKWLSSILSVSIWVAEGIMKVQLAQQVQELVGKSELVIITERVDDVALLIGQMLTMGLPEVLDRPIPRHGTQRGLSWGWTALMWLATDVLSGERADDGLYSPSMERIRRGGTKVVCCWSAMAR